MLNSNAILDHLPIIIRSILTTGKSMFYRVRRNINQLMIIADQQGYLEETLSRYGNRVLKKPPIPIWKNISQVLSNLNIWMILGFSTGFLIGMFNLK